MILLTGASGYLGRHVLERLRQRGVPCQGTSSEFDLTNPRTAALEIIKADPRVIIHCAARVPKTPEAYLDDAAALASVRMTRHLVAYSHCRLVFASSLTVTAVPRSAYAQGKFTAEYLLRPQDVCLRLPGLFGLPRRSGVIYESALKGEVKDSYGPYPSMHVKDAAEYLGRAATMLGDNNPEPFTVTYGNERLERVYGSLGVAFQQRVQELVDELRKESVCGH